MSKNTTATKHSSRYRGGLLINPIFSEMWIWVKRCHFDFSLRGTTHVMYNEPRTSRIVDYWLLISILTSMSLLFKGTRVRVRIRTGGRIQRKGRMSFCTVPPRTTNTEKIRSIVISFIVDVMNEMGITNHDIHYIRYIHCRYPERFYDQMVQRHTKTCLDISLFYEGRGMAP